MAKRDRISSPQGVVKTLPLSLEDDAILARAASEGHPGAIRAVYDRHANAVRAVLRRTMGRGEVDDLVQETFLRFFRLAERLRDPGKLKSFLIGIAVRVAREELRRRRVRRWLTLSGDAGLPEVEAPPPNLDAAEALNRLYELLDRVDARTRTIFTLRYVEQIPTSEIAEILDCSLATAKRRVQRATAKIHKLAAEDPVLVAFVSQEQPSSPLSERVPSSGKRGTGDSHG